MVRLTGNKINCSVFISGRGTNLKSIFNYSKEKFSKIDLKLVISDRSNAKGIKFAKKNKLRIRIIDYKNKQKAEKKILNILRENKIELICLAGFMRILSKNFINLYKNKIINIHPSLLPKYKGLNTHERVLQNKEKFSGCSVHFVSEKLDAGKIILQKKVRILLSDNPKKLSKRILVEENKLYPRAIKRILTKI
mgnify:CR=1 FL=1